MQTQAKPRYSKRHYEDVAKQFLGIEHSVSLELVAYRLADMFKQDNPLFDRQRFLNAAGFAGQCYA